LSGYGCRCLSELTGSENTVAALAARYNAGAPIVGHP
jgi:hypothetical protein